MWRRITLFVTFALLATVILGACGAPATPAQTAATTAPTKAAATQAPTTAAPTKAVEATNTQPAATPTAAAKPTNTPAKAEPTATAAPEVAKSVTDFPGVKSYRSTVKMVFSGPAYADQAESNVEIQGEYVREPSAEHIIMKNPDKTQPDFEMIRVGTDSYLKVGDQWMQTSSEEVPDFNQGLLLGLADFEKNDLSKLKKVGPETVNGIATTHYQYDKTTLLGLFADKESEFKDLKIAQGDIWVAKDGYVVKWSMQMEGVGVNASKPTETGAITFSQEIKDVNAKIEITAPKGASAKDALGVEIPLPAGAKQTLAAANMVQYQVPTLTVEQVAQFFKDNLPKQGFTYDDKGSMTTADNVLLQFKSSAGQFMIMISADPKGGVSVIITKG